MSKVTVITGRSCSGKTNKLIELYKRESNTNVKFINNEESRTSIFNRGVCDGDLICENIQSYKDLDLEATINLHN